jgi:hypothetical protein
MFRDLRVERHNNYVVEVYLVLICLSTLISLTNC